jgi:hypothetical protein
MSTLPNPAPAPSTPGPSTTGPTSRADRAALLPADTFTRADLADIYLAGGVFASAIADIVHHHIGDPGCWDCYGSAPDELARLHAALDQMAEAIKESRAWLTAVERRARRAAARSGGAA